MLLQLAQIQMCRYEKINGESLDEEILENLLSLNLEMARKSPLHSLDPLLQHYQQNAGSRWNQDPLDLVRTAGLKIQSSKRFGFGMFHTIVAR